MALPNPSMSFSPFDILTAEELNDLVENDQALAAGTGFNTGAIDASVVLQDNTVTKAKLAPGSVTQLGINTKTSLGTILPNAWTTYCTVNATSLGGQIQLDYRAKIRDGSSGAIRNGEIRVQMDGATVAGTTGYWHTPATNALFDIAMLIPSTASAGSHTWTLQVLANTASASYLDQATLKVDEIKP